MPITVLRGYDGKVTQGTADTALVALTDWEATATADVQEQGPFLNDSGTLYLSRGSRSLKGAFKGVQPSGKDASQTAVITALTGGTDIKLTMVSIGGYSIVVTTALIETIKLGQDASGTGTFEASFRDNGGFSIS